MTWIDLNADLGEGMGDDEAMIELVSSASVACGGHAGDDATMQRACRAARDAGVRIGAHVSFEDRIGFGRQPLQVPPSLLTAQLRAQIERLATIADRVGATVAYVKPHGALYNLAADDPATADVVLAATHEVDPTMAIMGLAGSVLVHRATGAGLAVINEGFADRAYRSDGRLADRSNPAAVHHDPERVVSQALSLALGRDVPSIDGHLLSIRAESVCVHGDTPGAVSLAAALRHRLMLAGVSVAAGEER